MQGMGNVEYIGADAEEVKEHTMSNDEEWQRSQAQAEQRWQRLMGIWHGIAMAPTERSPVFTREARRE